jgi:hypothetical protein
MVAMGSFGNEEMKERLNAEICRLRKGFEALTGDHKKEVLKTAQGLLRVQKAREPRPGCKNGYRTRR